MHLQLSHIITTCTHNYLHISYLFVNCMCDPDHPGCARCKWLYVCTMIEANPTVAWTMSNTHIYIIYSCKARQTLIHAEHVQTFVCKRPCLSDFCDLVARHCLEDSLHITKKTAEDAGQQPTLDPFGRVLRNIRNILVRNKWFGLMFCSEIWHGFMAENLRENRTWKRNRGKMARSDSPNSYTFRRLHLYIWRTCPTVFEGNPCNPPKRCPHFQIIMAVRPNSRRLTTAIMMLDQ